MNEELTREQLVYLAWKTGALKYKLMPHQLILYDKIREVLASKDPKKNSYVLNCSRQFGKSFVLFLIGVEECLRNPRTSVVFIAPLKNQVNEIITGNTFHVMFGDCPPQLLPKSDSSTVHFINSSRIRLAGTDNKNYENLRGGASNLILLDEAGFMDDLTNGVLSVVQPMTKTTKGKMIYSSTPPKTPDHDFTTIYREHQEQDLSSTYTIWDDTSMDERNLEKVILECGGKDSIRFQREFECKFVTDEDASIIPEWKEEYELEVPKDPYYDYYHKYVAMDIGSRDFTAVIFGYYHFKEACLVIEEEFIINGPKMTTNDLALGINLIESNLWGEDRVVKRRVADNNNLILLQDLSYLHGSTFSATTKTNLIAMVNRVRMMVMDGKIKVSPKCEQLIGGLKYGIKKPSGESIEFCRSKKYGHFDALAALVYLVRNLDTNTNPIPPNLGIDGATHWIPGGEQDYYYSSSVKAMSKIFRRRF